MKQWRNITTYIQKHELCGRSLAPSYGFDMLEKNMLWLKTAREKERRLKTGT